MNTRDDYFFFKISKDFFPKTPFSRKMQGNLSIFSGKWRFRKKSFGILGETVYITSKRIIEKFITFRSQHLFALKSNKHLNCYNITDLVVCSVFQSEFLSRVLSSLAPALAGCDMENR